MQFPASQSPMAWLKLTLILAVVTGPVISDATRLARGLKLKAAKPASSTLLQHHPVRTGLAPSATNAPTPNISKPAKSLGPKISMPQSVGMKMPGRSKLAPKNSVPKDSAANRLGPAIAVAALASQKRAPAGAVDNIEAIAEGSFTSPSTWRSYSKVMVEIREVQLGMLLMLAFLAILACAFSRRSARSPKQDDPLGYIFKMRQLDAQRTVPIRCETVSSSTGQYQRAQLPK